MHAVVLTSSKVALQFNKADNMDASDEEQVAAAAVVLSVLSEENLYKKHSKPKRRHRCWVRGWLTDRYDPGQCNTAYKLQKQLSECDTHEFQKMLRMSPECFNFVLDRIKPRIFRQDTNYRKAITCEESLSITLKFLATGESTSSLSGQYRLGQCTIGRVIKDTCDAIYEELGDEFIKTPSSIAEWKDIMAQFQYRWNYPVQIIKPWNSGSEFFNYKDYFSVVMLVAVNANYEYIYLDVGSEGKVSDGGIWKTTALFKAIKSGELNVPDAIELPGTDTHVSPHFIGDAAFALTNRMMKPYPGKHLDDQQAVFNYRLSRGRRIVENVFGITASRFRCLTHSLYMNPDSVSTILLAIATLHNILRQTCGRAYMPPGSVDFETINHDLVKGDWRKDKEAANIPSLDSSTTKNPTVAAKNMRDTLSEYFVSSAGEVAWQYNHSHNTHENMMRNLATA